MHAGFAAAIVLRESLLQDVLTIAWRAGRIPTRLAFNEAPITASLFLGLPQVQCAIAAGDRLIVTFDAWGRFTVRTPDGETNVRRVLIHARISLPLRVRAAAARISIEFDGYGATLLDLTIRPYVGGPFTTAARDYLEGVDFRRAAQIGIALALRTITVGIPVDITYLGAITDDLSNATAVVRVLDLALVIGINVAAPEATTSGIASALTDFSRGMSIAIVVNPAAVPLALQSMRQQVVAAAAANGATVDRFSATCEEGHLHITGYVSHRLGGVALSLDAVPHLTVHGWREEWREETGQRFVVEHPSREELWVELRNVVVGVDRAGLVYLFETIYGILTFGLAVAVVETIVDNIRRTIEVRIRTSGRGVARTQEFMVAGALVRMRIDRFEVHADQLTIAAHVETVIPAASIRGPEILTADDLPVAALNYSVTLPADAREDDTNLRIRWIVRRPDMAGIVMIRDGPAWGRATVSLDAARSALQTATRFEVECRVYRAFGSEVIDLYNGTFISRVLDRIDRTHPYVRWTHRVTVPNVEIEANGSRTILGWHEIVRRSRIHRTDSRTRCRMVAQYSPRVDVSSSDDEAIEYFDALPFVPAELGRNRHRVCDYCFFGGPTRTVALP